MLAGTGSSPNPVRPDLILLDLMLSGLSGGEVLSRIRELRVSKEIPVVVMSARGDVDSKVEMLLGGEAGREVGRADRGNDFSNTL